jgi:hypothetical protein
LEEIAVMKNPKSKIQNPNKLQVSKFQTTPETRPASIGIWNVGFWNLFGFWILGFGISPTA